MTLPSQECLNVVYHFAVLSVRSFCALICILVSIASDE